MTPWALLSLLLRYPDERTAAARSEVAALPDGPARAGIERFFAAASGMDLAAAYVSTFDLRRRASPYLTYYTHGDTRRRGLALLRLKKLYRAAGLPLDTRELPDHLAIMLAFAALAPPGHGEALLAEHRAPIELLRRSLHDLGSPYAHLLDAVAAGLAPLSARERSEVVRMAREGPPEEAVGLEPYGPPEATGVPNGTSLNTEWPVGRGPREVV
jgi:nitrate reductase molybdenum cofactor assembly chaperone NarJ/NarW